MSGAVQLGRVVDQELAICTRRELPAVFKPVRGFWPPVPRGHGLRLPRGRVPEFEHPEVVDDAAMLVEDGDGKALGEARRRDDPRAEPVEAGRLCSGAEVSLATKPRKETISAYESVLR